MEFSDSNGPGVMELKRMRQWLPELGQLPPAEARARIGKANVYSVGDFIGFTGERLIARGRGLGLRILSQRYTGVFRVPIHSDGTAPPIFEDEEKLEYIIQKMRDAGRPVTIIEED
ncbi:MAG: hypothetical protein H8F28_03945 [Fibrella sp.]|nr:hypothetical protein [Armatimonadota bacterium]